MAELDLTERDCVSVCVGIRRSTDRDPQPYQRSAMITLVFRYADKRPSDSVTLYMSDDVMAGEIATALNKIAAGEVVA